MAVNIFIIWGLREKEFMFAPDSEFTLQNPKLPVRLISYLYSMISNLRLILTIPARCVPAAVPMLLALVLLNSGPGFGQTPFKLSALDELSSADRTTLINKRNYQLLSAYDTVSLKPLLMYAIYMKNGKLGLIDHKGVEVTPPQFDEIHDIGQSWSYRETDLYANFIIKVSNRYGLIDKYGKTLLTPSFEYLRRAEADSILEEGRGARLRLIDPFGKPVIKPAEQKRVYQQPVTKTLNAAQTSYRIEDVY